MYKLTFKRLEFERVEPQMVPHPWIPDGVQTARTRIPSAAEVSPPAGYILHQWQIIKHKECGLIAAFLWLDWRVIGHDAANEGAMAPKDFTTYMRELGIFDNLPSDDGLDPTCIMRLEDDGGPVTERPETLCKYDGRPPSAPCPINVRNLMCEECPNGSVDSE